MEMEWYVYMPGTWISTDVNISQPGLFYLQNARSDFELNTESTIHGFKHILISNKIMLDIRRKIIRWSWITVDWDMKNKLIDNIAPW